MCLRIATAGLAMECRCERIGCHAVSRLARCGIIICVARSCKTHLRWIDPGCGSYWNGRRRTCYATNIPGHILADRLDL